MRELLKGIGYVFGERKLRPYVWGPMLIAGAVYVLITILAYVWLAPLVERWIAGIPILGTVSGWAGPLAFVIFWWLVSSILYLGIAGILSSFLWERLSREVEILEGTLPSPESKIGCGATFYDTALRGIVSVVIAVAAILLGWLFFGVVGVVLAGWLGLLDYTSNAFARRGILIDRQFRSVRKLPGWTGFLIAAGVVALFPFLNVLMLPALVAGGTILCGRGWRS